MLKILITDIVDDYLIQTLSANGCQINYQKNISQSEVEQIISEYDGIIITTKISLLKNTLSKGERLKFIARAGSGMDHVDLNYASSKNIICITSPEGNSSSVGEHCVALLLAIFHNIIIGNESVKKYEWKTDEYRIRELANQTIGIIGYGNTGPEFAKRIKPFGVNILAYDKYKKNYSDEFVKESNLEDLYEHCDVISIHLPLTPETNNIINYDFLSAFKKNIILINTSRGNIVNQIDLLKCISENKLIKAALDVLDNEFFETHTENEKKLYKSLFSNNKIIFTPHIAGKSHSTRFHHAQVLTNKILALIKL